MFVCKQAGSQVLMHSQCAGDGIAPAKRELAEHAKPLQVAVFTPIAVGGGEYRVYRQLDIIHKQTKAGYCMNALVG